MNIAVIGAGNVGGTLGRRWAMAGHTVRFGVKDPESPDVADLVSASGGGASAHPVAEAAAFAEVVVFATPWAATAEAIQACGSLAGKVVLDCTNPISADFSGLEFGTSDSAGERVAAWAVGAKVVKIFNTVGFNIMKNPDFGGRAATMLYAGDDGEAKATAAGLAKDLGFDPVDAGPLVQARYLEALAWLWISMAMKFGHGRDIVFEVVKR